MFNKILAVVYFLLAIGTVITGGDDIHLAAFVILSSLFGLAAEILDAVKGER